MSIVNHKERYTALIKDGCISIIDSFTDNTLGKFAETEDAKKSVIDICTMLNAYWREIILLRSTKE